MTRKAQEPAIAPEGRAERPHLRQAPDEQAVALARSLLRSARTGILAVTRRDGHPYAAKVLVCADFAGYPLLLISELGEHTAALHDDPRCCLLVDRPGKGDPLAHPRLSVSATARFMTQDDSRRDACRERFLNRHPKASLYADFEDFTFVRLVPSAAFLNGGFARAFDLTAEHLIDPEDPSLEQAALHARDHMNADHADAIGRIARHAGLEGDGWSITTVDRTGFEVKRSDRMHRIEFGCDVGSLAGGYREAFIDLVRAIG